MSIHVRDPMNTAEQLKRQKSVVFTFVITK